MWSVHVNIWIDAVSVLCGWWRVGSIVDVRPGLGVLDLDLGLLGRFDPSVRGAGVPILFMSIRYIYLIVYRVYGYNYVYMPKPKLQLDVKLT